MALYSDFHSRYRQKINQYGGIMAYAEHKNQGAVGAMVGRIAKHFRTGSQILEVGTGSGVLAASLAKKGFQVTAIDVSQEMIKIAEECCRVLKADVKLFVLDIFNVSDYFGVRKWDCVVSYSLMQHFDNARIISALRLQKSVGKKVIFCVPGAAIAQRYKKKEIGSERYYTLNQWLDILRQGGFSCAKVYGFGFGKISCYHFVPNVISYSPVLSRWLARFAGYYEFWLE